MWDNEKLAVSSFLSPRMEYWNPVSGQSFTIEVPVPAIGVTVSKGVFSAVCLVGKDVVLLKRVPGEDWQTFPVSLSKGSGAGALRGVPTTLNESHTEARYFALSRYPGFAEGRTASLGSWWRQGAKGVLEPEALVPMELGEPVFEPVKDDSLVPMPKLKARYQGLDPFLEHPIRTKEAFLIVSLNAGILWVVPDDATVPRRTLKLMALEDAWLAGEVKHPSVILGIQPMPDGRVLVAMRSEKAVRDVARPEAASQKPLRAEDPPARPRIDHPEILWKILDPMEGPVGDADPALLGNAPLELDPERPFSFSFDVDGRLVASGGRRPD
jgi:hypothetical protein